MAQLEKQQLINRIAAMVELIDDMGGISSVRHLQTIEILNAIGALEMTFLINQVYLQMGLTKTIKVQCTCNPNHYLQVIGFIRDWYNNNKQ